MNYFKTYYRATVIKIEWYWWQDRHIDQHTRIEDSKIDPHIYIYIIPTDFKQECQGNLMGRNSLFNKGHYNNWIFKCKNYKHQCFSHTTYKS